MAVNQLFYAVSSFAIGLDAILKWFLTVFGIVQIRFKWHCFLLNDLGVVMKSLMMMTDFAISSHRQEYSNVFLSESNAFFPHTLSFKNP